MTKLIGIFCNYANALKNDHIVEEVRDNETVSGKRGQQSIENR
jgi:hypothetical protein